jgi:hypothetical protein
VGKWTAVDVGGVVSVNRDHDLLAGQPVACGDDQPGFGVVPLQLDLDQEGPPLGDVDVRVHMANDARRPSRARRSQVQARPDVRRATRRACARMMRFVTPHAFTLVLTLAAVVIAVWVDLRLEARRPGSLMRRIGHATVAFVALNLSTAGVASMLGGQPPVGEQTLLLFLVFLPSMIYVFLTGVWLIRTLVEIAGLVRR